MSLLSADYKVILCISCAICLLPTSLYAQKIKYLKKEHKIDIVSKSIPFQPRKKARQVFGKLKWRGGLVLHSKFKQFGGISGIRVSADGKKIIGITDKGAWLSAQLIYKKNMLSGIKNVVMGPIKGHRNRILRKSKFRDAESLEIIGNRALIGFERKHRISQYNFSNNKILKKIRNLKLPKLARKLKYNKGFEALGIIKAGAHKGKLITFAENFKNSKGYHRGWLISNKKTLPIYLSAKNGFQITDLTSLKNGDLLVLERFFSFFEGVKMRIRKIQVKNIKPNAKLVGETLIEATNAYTIDNMEGIAVHVDSKGNTIITLISDDNFNTFQRTLIMQFEIVKND